MRGRHIAIACLPLSCTVLTDVDSLRTKTDASVDAGDAGETGSSDAPTEGGGGKTWLDDFNRPDSSAIGNAWIMKTASSHDILGNRVRQRTSGADYHDNIVYRPADEDVRDVTISVEFSSTALPPGYPQIMARVLQSTVQTPLAFDGYIFFLPNVADSAVIGRQRGTPYLTQLRSIPLNPPVDTSHTYRLTFTVTGTSPVVLSGLVEVKMGASWSTIGSDTYMDSDPTRLDVAGSVGFGSSGDEPLGTYFYDNFTRTSL